MTKFGTEFDKKNTKNSTSKFKSIVIFVVCFDLKIQKHYYLSFVSAQMPFRAPAREARGSSRVFRGTFVGRLRVSVAPGKWKKAK